MKMILSQMVVIILIFRRVTVLRIKLVDLKTVQSHTFSKHNSSLAIDGNTETCSITRQDSTTEEKPWWRVELDRIYNITDLKIFVSNRYIEFIQNLKIYISSQDADFREHLCASITKPIFVSGEYIQIECEESFFGNFVTIERFRGPNTKMLVLCEVRLNANLKSVNLAFERPTEQSGVLFKSVAGYSVDNNFKTCAVIRSFGAEFAWWRVILDDSYYITNVNIYFIANTTGQLAKKHVYIYVSNDDNYYEAHMCGNTEYPHDKIDERGSINITCKKPLLGNSVTIKKFTGVRPRWLILCEVEVFSRDEPREMDKTKVFKECHEFEYKCYEERCIHKDWLCDGTEDCPQGDDEAPTCAEQCGKDKFKCARRDMCIDIIYRCDGIVNCPDFSDEQACFQVDMKTNFLTATFKGESDFNICSHNWKIRHSFDVCCKLNRIYLDTTYEPIQDKRLKLLIGTNISEDDLAEMAHFQKGLHCNSGEIIKLRCELQRRNETSGICGTRGNPDGDYEPYVINGKKARDGAWPWHAQIFVNEQYKCGGSIINKNWILTAAHCLMFKVSSLYVKVGTNVFDDPHERKLSASHLIIHPLFYESEPNFGVDIALIRLKSPLVYSKFVRPICLPGDVLSNRTLMSYRHCIVSGFGRIDRNDTKPKYLQQGRMNLISYHECLKHRAMLVGKILKDFETNRFCAGSIPTSQGINVCQGDSGGPYMCKNEQRIWTLVGIISSALKDKTGMICVMGFFIKVDQYLDFINKVFQLEKEASAEAKSQEASQTIKHIFVPVTYIIMSCYFAIESIYSV